MDNATRILRLASTDRHLDDMQENRIVDDYLCGSLHHGANSWQTGYNMVLQWNDCGRFDDFDLVELYVTSKPLLNAGIISAFDDIGVPLRIYEYMGNSRYKVIERHRVAAK